MFSIKQVIQLIILFGLVSAAPSGLSIVINDGAASTNTINVNLTTLSAADAVNCSVSNVPGFSPGTTFSYPAALPMNWTLTSGDGTKTVHFKCSDTNGSWSSAVSDTIRLDRTSPSASSKTPDDSITSRKPEISAVLSDTGGSGIDESTIVLKLDGTTVSHSYDSGTVSYTPSTNLAFASHTVNLSVSDNAGNPYETSWTFTVSSGGVGLKDFSPTNKSYTQDKTPHISVVFTDSGSGINTSSLKMEFGGVDVTNDTEYASSSKTYSFSPSTLTEGSHSVEVWVKDNTGEESYAKWAFSVDTTKPTITLPVPPDDSIVANVPIISVKIEDGGSGINELQLFMDLNDVDISSSANYDTSSKIFSFSPTVKMAPGEYDVEVWAKDKVGNENSANWKFTVSSTNLIISSLTPANGSSTVNQKPEISAVITDPASSGIATSSIKISVDGTDVTNKATYTAGSRKISYTPTTNLADGTHNVEVSTKNNNDQQSTVRWSFTIDSTAPTQPTNFAVSQNENGSRLSWVLSTSTDIQNYILYDSTSSFNSLEGRTPLATLGATNNSYFHNVTSRYFYALVAQDKSGNKAQPVFAGSCAAYSSTSGWTDYTCCMDSHCLSGYYCDVTVHECKKSSGAAAREEAQAAIQDSQHLIDAAKLLGKNTTEAEGFLEDAQNAYTAGNYDQAKHFAELAADSTRSTSGNEEEQQSDKKALPCCPSAFIILAALGFVVLRR